MCSFGFFIAANTTRTVSALCFNSSVGCAMHIVHPSVLFCVLFSILCAAPFAAIQVVQFQISRDSCRELKLPPLNYAMHATITIMILRPNNLSAFFHVHIFFATEFDFFSFIFLDFDFVLSEFFL